MEQSVVARIKYCTAELERLVIEIAPQDDAEWDAFDQLSSAHRAMRRVDIAKISQLRFPETKAPAGPEKDQIPFPLRGGVVQGERAPTLNPGLDKETAYKARRAR